jgi:hypothetical protein
VNDDRISRDIACSAPFTSDVVTLAYIDHTPALWPAAKSTDTFETCNLYRHSQDSANATKSAQWVPFWELSWVQKFRNNSRAELRSTLCQSRIRSYFTTDGESVRMSWCRAPLSVPWSDFSFSFLRLTIALFFVLGHPLWREDGSVICSSICQWSELRRTHNHTLLSRLRLIRFTFRRLLRLSGITVEVFLPASTRGCTFYKRITILGRIKGKLLQTVFLRTEGPLYFRVLMNICRYYEEL